MRKSVWVLLVGLLAAIPVYASDDAEFSRVQAVMQHARQTQINNQAAQVAAEALAQQMSGVPSHQQLVVQQNRMPVTSSASPTSSTSSTSISPAATTNNAAPTMITPTSGVVSNTTVAGENVQQQIEDLNQMHLLFQQRANQQIAALTQQGSDLQSKLAEVNQTLAALSAQITKLQTQSTAVSASSSKEAAFGLSSFTLLYVIAGLLIFIVLLLLLLLKKKHKITQKTAPVSPKQSFSSDEDDVKDEYDFMGSTEAIPAKLDLARAYIAMEDFVAARRVLQQVIASGSTEQQQQAKQLLNQLPPTAS